ncbi:MAG: hypothetical protein J0L97_03650 [Alphaproteobacteria bacterium]|nr:hypothetical protein [Alphaproteobacteria bacterium]
MIHQLGLNLPPEERLEDRHFIIGDANRDAHAWIMAWPEWPVYGLYLYGPEGSGKSHLARIWAARAKARIIAPEEAEREAAAFTRGQALAVEKVDDTMRETDGKGLFHLCNSAREHQGFLLLVGRAAPAELHITLPDLRSRLLALPAISMSAPDDALLSAVLAKHFEDRGLRVPQEVIAYLMPRMERSFAAAAKTAARIDAYALSMKREITVPLAREAMDEMP